VKLGSYNLKLEQRATLTGWQATIISILAIIVALMLFSIIFILAEINPLLAYQEIFSYAFANPFGLPLTINRFIFLLLCTYAFIIPFRAGLWNIGMTGQLYFGTLAAFAVLFALNGKDSTISTFSPGIIVLGMVLA
jgi:simple sugar transport system permease protein